MPEDLDLEICSRLIERLGSEDAFERREAIESLALLTQRRFDYEWGARESDREAAISRWRTWIDERRKSQRGAQLRKKIQDLTGGKISAELFETLPEQAKMHILKQVLAQAGVDAAAKMSRQPCERCMDRPATVAITERESGAGPFVRRRLCEVCAGHDRA